MTVKSQKIAFRSQFKKVLLEIPFPTIEAESRIITEKILTCRHYIDAKSVSIFLNKPCGEINTTFILEDIFKSGKKCFVPFCSNTTMVMLHLKDMNDFLSLERNSWGIPEPKLQDGRLNAFEIGLDLIIMPGMAFDRKGNRIGYGKGYYDRFLEKMDSISDAANISRPYTIAIGLRKQMVDIDLPTEETDRKPDLILV